MADHSQHNPLSQMVHKVFGHTLMAAGLARIIEIAFVLRDAPEVGGEAKSWQFLPPYVSLRCGGEVGVEG